MRRVPFRAVVCTSAAALALLVLKNATGITTPDPDVRRASVSKARTALGPAAGPGAPSLAPQARSLQFTPLSTTPTTGVARPMSAGQGPLDAHPPTARPIAAAGAPVATAAWDSAAQTVAPPSTAQGVVNQFDFRIEPTFRQQLDAVVTPAQSARLLFPVAQDRMVDLQVTRHDTENATRGVVYAHLAEHPEAQAVLAYVDDAVAGSIVTSDGELFVVRYAGGGVHRVLQLDPNQIPPEGELPMEPAPSAAEMRAAAARRPVRGRVELEMAADVTEGDDVVQEWTPGADAVADAPVAADSTDTQMRDGTSTIIDMLIVYTPQSRVNNGGYAGMSAVINASVAKANLAFANSRAGVILRVVHTAEVNYTTAGIGNDLAALRNKTDGRMDEVFTLRIQYNADLVSLFVTAGNDGIAGIAYLLNPLTMGAGVYDSAFSAVVDVFADGNISFAHEVGHNLGAGHDTCCGVFSYAMGHRFTAAGQTYRTVMAYSPGLRIPWFSNPDVSYLGVPVGTASANNTLTISRTRAGMATSRHGTADWSVSTDGDFNADGRTDLVWRNVLTGRVVAWLMNGVTRTSTPVLWPATTAGDSASVPMVRADMNADGKPDLVWRNTTTGQVVVWYMDGVNRTTSAVLWPATNASDAAWIPMAGGDFNADGKPDLVWRNSTTGRVVVWFMDGATRTGTAVIWAITTPADAAWVPLASGDFNGDTKPDLIWRHSTTGRVIIWYMDGATRTGTSALWSPTNASETAWRPMATGDFNADAQVDIIWRNTDTGQVLVWYMNGATPASTAAIW
jgi:hypothetical protein